LFAVDSGICYFFVEVMCASKDLHSGVYGGTVYVCFIAADIIHVRPAKLRDSIRIGRSDSIQKWWANSKMADSKIFESAVRAHCSS